MEFKIIKPEGQDFIKTIEWNHEEIKAEIAEKVQVYNSLVYTDDQIKEAKADRAELNKFKTALETKRKEIKSQCLEPYEKFEKQMKEIIAVIDEPIAVIDKQVKAFDEAQKQKKEADIKAYFDSKEFHGFAYEKIADPKWLNASTSMKSITEAIDAKAAEIEADLQIINALPEYSFEAGEVYKQTQDVRSALAESNRLTELAKAKAEFEKQQAERAAAEAKAAEEMPVFPDIEPVEEEIPDEPEEIETDDDFLPDFGSIASTRTWVAIKAFATPEDLEALKAFFDSRSVPFETM